MQGAYDEIMQHTAIRSTVPIEYKDEIMKFLLTGAVQIIGRAKGG